MSTYYNDYDYYPCYRTVKRVQMIYLDGGIDVLFVKCQCSYCLKMFSLNAGVFSRRYGTYVKIVEMSEDKSNIYVE